MIRKQVFFLYRTKLRICRYMGYELGDWRYENRPARRTIQLRDINRYIRTDLIGCFIWNNVRIQYKMNMNEQDPFIINDALDEAFVSLKYINYLMCVYKEKHKKLLIG